MPDQVFNQAPGPQQIPFRVELGDFTFPNESLGKVKLRESLDGNIVVKRVTIDISHPPKATWDYHEAGRIYLGGVLRMTGVCTEARPNEDGSITLEIAGIDWIMQESFITGFWAFGMPDLEILYWFQRIATPEIPIEVEGLDLDESLRPFMYAVPVKGLSSSGAGTGLAINDSGIASHDWDNIFQPLLDRLEAARDREYWQAKTPKIFGVVLARNLMEAETLSLKRANTTLDLINFACSNGISHFVTRYEETPLPWDAKAATAISLYPCILVRELQTAKGWIRDLPGIRANSNADLPQCVPSIKLIAENLAVIHRYGDLREQKGETTLSQREQKLFGGIQRALRWLTISTDEHDTTDQLIATWTALEAVLNSAEYPQVFSGPRAEVGQAIKERLADVPIPQVDNPLLSITTEMLLNRVLQGQWSLKTKLQIFAASFGIELDDKDADLVGRLHKVRSSALHTGSAADNLTKHDIRSLQNLVRRLIMATAIGGYQDLESQISGFHFGEIGPEGGAAPLFIDGEQVPYTLTGRTTEDGDFTLEVVTGGKYYNLTEVPYDSDC